jgi:hypothetical protein
MNQRLIRTTISAAGATAVAGVIAASVLSAQPAPTPEANRQVIATGCLKQQKDQTAPSTIAADEKAVSKEDFVLMDARITAAAPAVTPTATPSPNAQSAEERKSAPSGASGAAGAGTSGTGSTSVQATEHPPSEAATRTNSAASPTGTPSANIGPESQTMFKVVGLSPETLQRMLNQQVQIEGRLDVARMTRSNGAALRQPGVAAGRDPASTPNASAPPAQAPTADADRPTLATSPLPELRGMSIRALGDTCKGTE